MAIVFPASPSVNETFTEGSITYKCVGTDPIKWIGLGTTPADRLVEGSNSLEINASNELVWTGSDVGIGTNSPGSDGGTTLEIYNATTPTLKLNDGDEYKALLQLRGNDLEIRGSNGLMEFFTGNVDGASSTKKLSITSAGQLLIHHDTNVAPDGYESMLQLADDSYQGSSTVWKRAAGSSAGANPALILQKVRGADIDGQGAVADSDSIGQIRFYGADGTTAIECGNISATVDNTTSTNNVPGKLVFKTAKLQAGSGSPVNPTQAMTIKANHNVEIHDGNLVFETAGTGIDFSANANAVGMSSELFDDYEEGTFTAVLNSNTNATVTNSSINNTTNSSNASYTKVGRLVTVTCRFAALHVDAKNNVLLYITGLPFTSWVGNATTACIGEQRGLYFRYGSSAETTNMHHLYGYIGASTTTLSLGASKGSGPYSGWPATHDSSSSIYLNLTIQYITDT